ncbi:transcriptional enhancer factor TEF-1 [Eurytemora carolleeae]|uniref:transcriptional enhancer factor TEF-1 n=1 Tax=Eurytemora carolleeae TaxID=1294199 RepID=UPI000C785C06|nr:transcriptional enhancer factor TEF-1 [Eurytemora carolleeae]|eukprot:XP_023346431.1 transcriptional enhancer factor TEF-1-like [Eurytemora affinis]
MPESTHISPGEGVNARLGAPQPTSLEERKSPLESTMIMQGADAVRLVGVSESISQQIAKYDSSEFDDDKETVGTDAEGVWAPDIEQSFQEALAIYPPCGRRKIILSDEGKMYGRNELIARYIKLRTGKTRTRKQVSSHIQVLARRKLREIQAKLKAPNQTPTTYSEQTHKEKAIQQMQQMSSAQIVSASALHSKSLLGSNGAVQSSSAVQYPNQFWQPAIQTTTEDVKPFQTGGFNLSVPKISAAIPSPSPAWLGRSIATSKLRLLEHSAFVDQQRETDSYHKHLFVHIGGNYEYSDPSLEPVDVRQIQDKFPEKSGGLKELYEKGPQDAFFLVKFWADLNTNISDESSAFYGVTTTYESSENMTIQCSTKVCSFGKQVVEKVETEYARFEGGRYLYKIHRSPMCEYMINFILKLKHLPEKYMMNSVLENFTILQVITNRDTGETLLCVAYVFEVSTSEHGAQHHVYKLVKD